MQIDQLLNKLKNVKLSGKQWTAQCPSHQDRQNSLSISPGDDGRILLKCFTGCVVADIMSSLNLSTKDLFAKSAPSTASVHQKTTTTMQRGCTLEQYAKEKQLDINLLRSEDVRNHSYSGASAIRIPYYDLNRIEIAVRYRTALKKSAEEDNRFKWKIGSKLNLYGLWHLDTAKKNKYVLIVEGESDTHTAWQHNLPVLGLPGAANWKELWAEYLEDISKIYIVLEPDKGGEAVLKWLSRSTIRNKTYLVSLPNAKDLNELHCQGAEQFKETLQQALDSSVQWQDYSTKNETEKKDIAWKKCSSLAQQENILDAFAKKIEQSGAVGVSKEAKLVYLCATSRILTRPVSAVIKATSSAGKSFLVDNVLKYFPASAYYVLTAMSERALIYDDEPLKNRMLVIVEVVGMQGDITNLIIRSLLSEGYIRYKTVEKTKDGMKPRLIEREGPTGLLVTTTNLHLHAENETRLFAIPMNDSAEQTATIMMAMANENRIKIDYAEWHALQEWIQHSDHEVTIPYAHMLAEIIPPVAVRLRRDFKSVLNLITTSAILHQAIRKRNHQNKIIATFEDYEIIRDLIVDILSQGLETTVSQIMRETVQTVERLKKNDLYNQVTFTSIARELSIDKSTAKRRADSAVDAGYLKNGALEKRPADLSIGDPLPDDHEILPTREELERRCMVASKNERKDTDQDLLLI
ncbi:MAG: toprim domain-containing protein [Candidatus Andersenbacteria bacterium]